jgi:hypothetical protein
MNNILMPTSILNEIINTKINTDTNLIYISPNVFHASQFDTNESSTDESETYIDTEQIQHMNTSYQDNDNAYDSDASTESFESNGNNCMELTNPDYICVHENHNRGHTHIHNNNDVGTEEPTAKSQYKCESENQYYSCDYAENEDNDDCMGDGDSDSDSDDSYDSDDKNDYEYYDNPAPKFASVEPKKTAPIINSYYSNISDYLNSHAFELHPNGNSMLFGLNSFGCNSVILYQNDIWKFYAFESGTDNAIYYNKDGKRFVFNTHDTQVKSQITRLQEKECV